MTEDPRGFGMDHPHKCFPAIPSPEVEELQRRWKAEQERWYRRDVRNRKISLAFLVPAVIGAGLMVVAIQRTDSLLTVAFYIGGYVLAVPMQIMGTYLVARPEKSESVDKPAEPDSGR
jgi:L-asparagine transporter-like permease